MKVIMKEIEMITYFNTDGLPKPIRFRIQTEDSELKKVISIDSILHIEQSRKAGIPMLTYHCQAVINGLMRRFEIIYETTKYKWFLFKI